MTDRFRNILKSILFICLLCSCVTACSGGNRTNAGYTEIESEGAEDTENSEADLFGEEYACDAADKETAAADEQEELSGSDKFFLEKQEHISDISNGQCSLEKIGKDEYVITLYDKEHEAVDSIVYSYHEPWVEMVTDTLLEINFNAGNPARYTFYFDMETAKISDTYFNSILFGDRYIAYMAFENEDEITLTLTDIFKEQILYQEIIRDFSLFADYMGAVIGIEMIDEQNIRLEYYEGTDMTIVSEIIALELENEAESIGGLNVTAQTQEERDLIREILSENEEELQTFLMEDWEWPYVQWWVEISGFDFTGDGEEEIILSKCYVYISQTISYNYVYDRGGNKLLEFVGGSLSGMHIISGWEGDGTFLIFSGNYYAAHLEANIFTEIKWEDGELKEEVKVIEYDTRDSRQAMEGKEGYYILKDITKEEGEKLWYGVDGLAELREAKEYVWEDEDLKRYKQLFYEEDTMSFSGKGGVIYQKWDGLFAWDKSVGYTVEDRTFSTQEGEWSVQIFYPYFSDNSSYTCTDEVNRAIEQEIRNRCETLDDTISYEIDYEIKYREHGSVSILFYGRRIPAGGDRSTNIAWGVSYIVSSGRHTYVEDIMRMPELTDKLENREFEQVWGVGIDSYEADVGAKDWSRIYSQRLLNSEDKEHYEDFYITDKKIGILLCVSREAGDYIIVEMDRDWQIKIQTWEDILSS